MSSIRKIGILGAGRAGTAIARAAARAGVDTQIASTRSPSQMKYHLLQYAPSTTAVYAHDIAADVDVVVLVVPQEDLDDVSPDWVGEGILVDATNRWEDEPLPEWFTTALNSGLSSSEVIAQQFPRTRVVKALNHISHWAMDTPRADDARAAAVASDHDEAAQKVAELLALLGFDPVVADSLAAGRQTEPGTTYFNVAATSEQLTRQLL